MIEIHGTPWGAICFLVGLMVLILVYSTGRIIVWNNRIKHYQEPTEQEIPKQEEAPILRQNAQVAEKKVDLLQTGNSKRPSHEMEYSITFLLESGETRRFIVSQLMFDQILDNERGILITQGEELLEFNNKFSTKPLNP